MIRKRNIFPEKDIGKNNKRATNKGH